MRRRKNEKDNEKGKQGLKEREGERGREKVYEKEKK